MNNIEGESDPFAYNDRNASLPDTWQKRAKENDCWKLCCKAETVSFKQHFEDFIIQNVSSRAETHS